MADLNNLVFIFSLILVKHLFFIREIDVLLISDFIVEPERKTDELQRLIQIPVSKISGVPAGKISTEFNLYIVLMLQCGYYKLKGSIIKIKLALLPGCNFLLKFF